MFAHVPCLDVPESNDNGLLAAELVLGLLRSQVAVVQSIADRIEQIARPRHAARLRTQLAEEMARLGCHLLEAAEALIEPSRSEDRGIVVPCSLQGAGSRASRR